MIQFRIHDYLYSIVDTADDKALVRGEIRKAPEQCLARNYYLHDEPTSRILADAIHDSGLKTREQRLNWIRKNNPNFS